MRILLFAIRLSVTAGLLFCQAASGQEVSATSPGIATAPGAGPSAAPLKVVFLRHAEKPLKGDNLSCQGLNRSMLLPPMLYARFGIPTATYIPSMALGDSTKHSRMFQTLIPFAVKYNLALTSKFEEKDSVGIARDILEKKGTVLVVWEHKCIVSIVRALGIDDKMLLWPDDDYESIWTITFENGKARMSRSTEGLQPSEVCPF
jgi:hypothetical protein